MANIFDIIKAIILGIVQGITEWLPISSTGHLILFEKFLTFNDLSADFFNVFKVVIQFGSILAVVVLYFNTLNPFSRKKSPNERILTWQMWVKVLIASIPAAIVGLLIEDIIDSTLSSVYVIAAALIIYGFLFIWLENRNRPAKFKKLSTLSYKTAFFIGCFQMLALIPGTSRSGSTILGAVFLGASRSLSAEFSFFMAIPVMAGASGLKLLKGAGNFTSAEWLVLFVGSLISFIVSLFVIKFLISYIKKHDFKIFGYYRIVLGIIIVLLSLISAL